MTLNKLRRWVLGSINYEMRTKIAGRIIKVPVINNVGRAHLDEHEPHMEIIFQRLHTAGMLLIDVGANIGQTLVKYAAVAGNSCRYIGFEPNSKAASYVEEIILRNEMNNAMIIPVGLASETRLATLFMHSAGSTDPAASMQQEIRDADFYGSHKTIPVFEGDQVLAELDISEGPTILKIDVEGAELEVLHGLENSIARLRPLIILEILPPSYFSKEVNDYRIQQADDIKRHLGDRGYTVHAIGTSGEVCRGVSPTGDYVFVPKEKVDLIRLLNA